MLTRTRLTVIAAAALCVASLAAIPIALTAAPGNREGKGQRAEGRAGRPDGPRFGGPGHEGPGGHFAKQMIRFWENDRISGELNLTEEQVKLLDETHTRTHDAMEALRTDADKHREAVREEMDKDKPSLDKVNELAEQAGKFHEQRLKLMLGHRVAVKNILSAEQIEKLDEARKEFGRERGPKAFKEMRERFRAIESPEELEAALDQRGVPDERRERIRQMWERMRNNQGGDEFDGPPPPPRRGRGGKNGPPPPPPGEDMLPPLPPDAE